MPRPRCLERGALKRRAVQRVLRCRFQRDRSEIKFGGAVVRNVVVLVMDDKQKIDLGTRGSYQIDGVL